MKTKSYLKSQRKKSFASLILALLLMFTFNSSPIIMLSDNLRNRTSAYKSSETQTYYAKNDSTEETKFSSVYPSSLKDYFKDSSENFNMLSYYTTQFDLVYKDLVNAFFTYYYTSKMTPKVKNEYENLFSYFGQTLDSEGTTKLSISDLFTKLKGTNFAEKKLEKYEFMYFAETLAVSGFEHYDDENSKTVSGIVANTYGGYYKNLSNFYRLLANYSINNDIDSGEPSADGDDHPNSSISTLEAFYNNNTHYLRLKKHIDEQIAKKTPLYAYDGETNNTYIAGIFANMAPTTVKYNYTSDSYDTYTSTTYKFVTTKQEQTGHEEKVEKNQVYYFGTSTQLALGISADDSKYFVFNNEDNAKSNVDLLLYRLVKPGEFGYIDGEETYYKYDSTSYPYTSQNSKSIIYVLTDNDTTQSQLDTYSSIFFQTITSDDLASNFYVQIPYQNDKLFFDKVYDKCLFASNISFTRDEFYNYFTKRDSVTGNIVSLIYFKYSTSDYRTIYIDQTKKTAFETAYPNYSYNLVGVDMSASEYNSEDYEKITTSNGSSYINNISSDYTLYFKKTISFYEDSTTNEYTSGYETTFEPIKNLESHDVASSAYEKDSSGNRDIFVVTDSDDVLNEVKAKYTNSYKINQTEIDNNSSFYVEVPTSLYPEGLSKDTYKLYYKHSSTTVNKIFVVDDSDNAQENEVYKKYNFIVIKSNDIKNNYSNYLALTESDTLYDENYKLYYKYDRTINTSKVYIEDDGTEALRNNIKNSSFKLVGSDKKAQSDYYEIPRPEAGSSESSPYNDASLLALIPEASKENLTLFYKYSDVFVQNELKGGNAIYVSYSSSSVGLSDKEYFTKNLWTPVKKTEIEANPDLYVALDKTIDPNYSDVDDDYKLYYKYVQSSTATNVVYDISDIDTTKSDFDANAYHLIQDTESGYVAGKELYYKKILTKTNTHYKFDTPTYYYYQTSSTVSISANSYYVISFYVQTHDAEASFVIKDTSDAIENIALNNISTSGKWQQYFIFISTNAITASNVNFYLYLGDEEHGIKGTKTTTTFTGSVFFDDIKITKIGLSDFNKYSINDEKVYLTNLTTGEGDEKTNVEGSYADKYNNQIFIANLEAIKTVDARFDGNKFNNIEYIDDTNWNNMFNFDNATSSSTEAGALRELLGFETNSNDEDIKNLAVSNKLIDTLGAKTNGKYTIKGKDMYKDFTGLWRYYITRDTSSSYEIDNYRSAYANGKLDVTLTNIIEEAEKDDDAEDSDESKDDEKDYIYSSSPFNDDNYALKLTNKHKDISLGITSNAFTVKRYEYYKITLWIYSPNLEGTATISVNSVMQTRNEPVYGSLVSASLSNINANVANSSNENAEFGWIPVTFYIEGNNLEDMNCYLVLQADKDCTVYFDNITIEKTTSSKFDTAQSSSSDKYSKALSLIPSSSIDAPSLKNGNFDYVTVSDMTQTIDSSTPYTADNWTKLSSNSSRVIAGVVSMTNNTFFSTYNDNKKPTEIIVEGSSEEHNIYDNNTNVYAIHAPKTLKALDGSTDILNYKHNYSVYSNSISLTASTVYKITFRFYKGYEFNGNLVSKIYLSSVKDANVISELSVNSSNIANGWQTFTYYIATGTSSSTIYLEIGVKDANGTCFFKNADYEKLTSTMDSTLADVAKENGITGVPDMNLVNKLTNVKFLDMANMSFGYRSDNVNSETNLFDQSVMTDKAENSTTNTVGTNGVIVASYLDTTYTTTYSVTIDKVTYYIGEVYTVTINNVEYYVHKTYDSVYNKFNYALCTDSDLTNEITKIGENNVTINATADKVDVVVGETTYTTTVSYRLFKFSDLRNEVKTIDGSIVSVPGLDKVVVGSGSKATNNTTTSSQNASYTYHFDTNTQKDFEINNTIIPASELENYQSANVLVLANNYKTDYVKLLQTTSRTIGTSTQYVLRIYVKTSDFASDDYGLNIKIDAVNVEWTNINTTNSKNKDDKGFVCYEVLIQSNSSDSISDFKVELSLGTTEKTGTGYAIISKVSLDSISSADEFTHYSELVGDDNENIKKAIYASTSSDEEDKDSTEDADDKNSISWATFFYIFSSILLVVTMIVAMVALILKKHPIKLAQKYENDHDRDISASSNKNYKNKSAKNEVSIGEDRKFDKKNSGGIE